MKEEQEEEHVFQQQQADLDVQDAGMRKYKECLV